MSDPSHQANKLSASKVLFHRYTYGKLIQGRNPNGPIVRKTEHELTGLSRGFISALQKKCLPEAYYKRWPGVLAGIAEVCQSQGAFLYRPVKVDGNIWCLFARVQGRSESGSEKKGRIFSHCAVLACPAHHWQPMIIPEVRKALFGSADNQNSENAGLPDLQDDADRLSKPMLELILPELGILSRTNMEIWKVARCDTGGKLLVGGSQMINDCDLATAVADLTDNLVTSQLATTGWLLPFALGVKNFTGINGRTAFVLGEGFNDDHAIEPQPFPAARLPPNARSAITSLFDSDGEVDWRSSDFLNDLKLNQMPTPALPKVKPSFAAPNQPPQNTVTQEESRMFLGGIRSAPQDGPANSPAPDNDGQWMPATSAGLTNLRPSSHTSNTLLGSADDLLADIDNDIIIVPTGPFFERTLKTTSEIQSNQSRIQSSYENLKFPRPEIIQYLSQILTIENTVDINIDYQLSDISNNVIRPLSGIIKTNEKNCDTEVLFYHNTNNNWKHLMMFWYDYCWKHFESGKTFLDLLSSTGKILIRYNFVERIIVLMIMSRYSDINLVHINFYIQICQKKSALNDSQTLKYIDNYRGFLVQIGSLKALESTIKSNNIKQFRGIDALEAVYKIHRIVSTLD